uniref:hypothetical protein n=1 Tax=Legionella sainthelensi TaxID=28087 RepID=UPI001A949D1D
HAAGMLKLGELPNLSNKESNRLLSFFPSKRSKGTFFKIDMKSYRIKMPKPRLGVAPRTRLELVT